VSNAFIIALLGLLKKKHTTYPKYIVVFKIWVLLWLVEYG
jgi:hypothetical protein